MIFGSLALPLLSALRAAACALHAGLGMEELPRIEGLSAGLLPHGRWAVSRWFYANPVWYYHRPSAAHEIDTAGRFYQLVDPELRELCRVLNDAGIRTTPSCQGHSYPRERFERIWDALTREAEAIRDDRLIVRDSENQRAYLFGDADYRVPWDSFDAFYRESAAHQNKGYLGMIIPHNLPEMARRLREEKYRTVSTTIDEDPELSRLLGGLVFAVRVDAVDPQARSIEWQDSTAYLRRMVGDVLGAHPV